MTVFQIIIEKNIPEARLADIESVKDWCKYQGYNYKAINSLPDDLQIDGLSSRIASDYLRTETLLKNPYYCYVDWDVNVIDKTLVLEDKPILVPFFDWFIYNADRTDIFELVYNNMIERKKQTGDGWKVEEGTIYKAFRTVYYEPEWVKCDINKYLIHYNVSKL
jgi:hypothetical protein